MMNHPNINKVKPSPESDLAQAITDTVQKAVEHYDQGGFWAGLARKKLIEKLNGLKFGRLLIEENGLQTTFGKIEDANECPAIKVTVLHSNFWTDLAFGGSAGGGEAFIRGYWLCDDIVGLTRLLIRNSEVLQGIEGRSYGWSRILDRLRHFTNRNTQTGSAANIAAHYDLGNDFFGLFLDQKLMYSSAFYPTQDTNLEDAATIKLDRICQKLNLTAEDRVLEIGTGWGGFAIYAAKHYGCHVTTTTISKEQHALAKQRIADEGLNDRITLLLQDYRELSGRYDKLVSIEMIEAVGHQFLDTYIAQCSNLLTDEGELFIQAITIRDQHYKQAIKEVDYIKKFIFPGGFLPSITAITGAMNRVSDMKMVHLEDIGEHYARTLADWRERFLENLNHVRAFGYPETFIRRWLFYLCYCEGSFRESYIGVVQLLANKPRAKTATFNADIKPIEISP